MMRTPRDSRICRRLLSYGFAESTMEDLYDQMVRGPRLRFHHAESAHAQAIMHMDQTLVKLSRATVMAHRCRAVINKMTNPGFDNAQYDKIARARKALLRWEAEAYTIAQALRKGWR